MEKKENGRKTEIVQQKSKERNKVRSGDPMLKALRKVDCLRGEQLIETRKVIL
jgi:hypothetical protein